jgi:hypothetical protein
MKHTLEEIISVVSSHTEFCKKTFAWSGDVEKDIYHAVLGIVGEMLEFGVSKTPENRIEEIGDIFYYICIVYFLTKQTPQVKEPLNNETGLEKIVNMTKKMIAYKHNVQIPICELFFSYLEMIEGFDLSLSQIAESNRIKLTKRYPNLAFSSEDAEKRADTL